MGPEQIEQMGAWVMGQYARSEEYLLRYSARLANQRGLEALDTSHWAVMKHRDIARVRKEALSEIAKLQKVNVATGKAVVASYGSGYMGDLGAFASLRTVATHPSMFFRTNAEAATRLAAETMRVMNGTHANILRSMEDGYRSVIADTVFHSTVGTMTRKQAMQAALNRWADMGISGFMDKAGRRWEISSYCEMASRTAMARAHVEGKLARITESGRSLVIVSDSPDECPLCRPWEGRILAVGDYHAAGLPKGVHVAGTLSEAIEDGLFHPNCTHDVNPYIAGLTLPMKQTQNPMGYQERQRQRELERNIRKWRRRESVAMTPESKARARAKADEWNERSASFHEQTGRRRMYDRERYMTGTPGTGGANLSLQPPVTPSTPGVPRVQVKYPMKGVYGDRERQLLDKWAANHGLSPTAYQNEVTKRLKEVTDKADIIVRYRDEATIEKILDSGRLKSQFETGTSSGINSPEIRTNVEQSLFGAEKNLPAADRPIYGMLYDESAAWHGQGYGKIMVKIDRGAVANRTTVTLGDSLAAGGGKEGQRVATAHMLNKPGAFAWVEAHKGYYHADNPYGDPLNWLKDAATDATESGVPLGLDHLTGQYAEVQMHGGVPVSLIKEIAFPYQPSPSLVSIMLKLGIKYIVGAF